MGSKFSKLSLVFEYTKQAREKKKSTDRCGICVCKLEFENKKAKKIEWSFGDHH